MEALHITSAGRFLLRQMIWKNRIFIKAKDEYLFFMGSDPMNMFDFDSEIEIFIGDDPDHMEAKLSRSQL
jgi:hypothetical protein